MKILGIIPARCPKWALVAWRSAVIVIYCLCCAGCATTNEEPYPSTSITILPHSTNTAASNDGAELSFCDDLKVGSSVQVFSPFRTYDQAIVKAVETRWHELLKSRKLPPSDGGTVVLEFDLWRDGRVTSMVVARSDVDGFRTLICQKAVLDPSPFRAWPKEMATMVNHPHREIRFTFHYR